MLRGDHATAIPLLERLHSEAAPRSYIGWTALSGALAQAYNETGQFDRAEAVCAPIVAELSDEDRLVVCLTLNVELELAVAEARLGRVKGAVSRLERLLHIHETQCGAITLGSIHKAWGEVARAAGDADLERFHGVRMDYWYRSTNNPSLIAESERLIAAFDAPAARHEPSMEDQTSTVVEHVSQTDTMLDTPLGDDVEC
jgi:hypothetical protein